MCGCCCCCWDAAVVGGSWTMITRDGGCWWRWRSGGGWWRPCASDEREGAEWKECEVWSSNISPKFSKFRRSTCRVINTLTHNNSSVVWMIIVMAWLNLPEDQNHGSVAPDPSLWPHSTMQSRPATPLWFSWCSRGKGNPWGLWVRVLEGKGRGSRSVTPDPSLYPWLFLVSSRCSPVGWGWGSHWTGEA